MELSKWKRYFGQGASNTSIQRFSKDRRLNPKIQRVGLDAQVTSTCKNCGKTHKGEYLAGSNVCYRCDKLDHHDKECRGDGTRPQIKGQTYATCRQT